MRRMSLGFRPADYILLSSDWWDEINDSVQWQDGIFFTLCAAYGLVSSVALIQLIRIELRVPEYGWTTQKVFHLMNFIVNGVRAVVFGFHNLVFMLSPKGPLVSEVPNPLAYGSISTTRRRMYLHVRLVVLCLIFAVTYVANLFYPLSARVLILVVLDLPGIVFFSTYTLLVLFWAEIYYQAKSLPTDKLRIVYLTVNGAVYLVQVGVWVYLWIDDNSVVEFIGRIFIGVVSIIAALGFLFYGGRLFFMLRRFPIESKGRRKKLHEVGSVTAICFTCFLVRCIVVLLSAFDSNASLDVLDHPILDLIYYTMVEILPSALVLFILRKLPPKRISAQYHPIR